MSTLFSCEFKALSLMNFIGSPIIKAKRSPTTGLMNIGALFDYACVNRIGYYFLHKLSERKMLSEEDHLYRKYVSEGERYRRILKAMVKLTRDLGGAGVDFAIFKSLRPYPSTTVDIDTVLFEDYGKAYVSLRRRGYSLLGLGPETITLLDPSHTVGVDLYREISVSRIVYLDKGVLRKHVALVETGEGFVRTLCREADIVAFCAHIAFKEHMFTLADYYTILHHVINADPALLKDIVEETSSVNALSITLTLVNTLHYLAHGSLVFTEYPLTLQALFEATRLIRRGLKLPHKFHYITIASTLTEKVVKDPYSRKSIAYQLSYLAKPKYLIEFVRGLRKHFKRETY